MNARRAAVAIKKVKGFGHKREMLTAIMIDADDSVSDDVASDHHARAVSDDNKQEATNSALSSANQQLLSRNAQLQRQVNDLQTQVNVLIYESKGQLFLYGALTVLISLLVGIFISWLMFGRRARW